MKKKILLLLMGVFSIGILLHAQVGINTNSPQGVLHIHPTGIDNSKDIVFTSSGNFGVSAGLAPTHKLHIKADHTITSGLILEDASSENGYVMSSIDNSGKGKWSVNDFAPVGVVIWEGSTTRTIPSTVTFFSSDAGTLKQKFYNVNASQFSLTSGGFHKIPPGSYLVFLNGDVFGEEYVSVTIKKSDTSDSYLNANTLATFYCEHMIAGTAFFECTVDTRLMIDLRNVGMNGKRKNGIMLNDTNAHKINFKITLVKLA